jgi:hypothetical protein
MGVGDLVWYGSDLRQIARALYAEGRLAELKGDTDEAVTRYLDGMQLGRSMLGDGLVVDYLVGMAIEDMSAGALRRIRHNLSCVQSRALLDEIQGRFQPHPSPHPHLRLDEIWEQNNLEWQGQLGIVLRRFAHQAPSMSRAVVELHQRDQALLNLLATDLALRSFQCDHSRLPQSLSELTPKYLPAELNDPFSGKPLVYRPQGTQFQLYSVGDNQRDDGGTRGQYWFDADILLDPPPQPAAQPM